MTREEAIEMCRARALAARQRGDAQEYLPSTPAEADTWLPHEWVIEAVLDASSGSGYYRRPPSPPPTRSAR